MTRSRQQRWLRRLYGWVKNTSVEAVVAKCRQLHLVPIDMVKLEAISWAEALAPVSGDDPAVPVLDVLVAKANQIGDLPYGSRPAGIPPCARPGDDAEKV